MSGLLVLYRQTSIYHAPIYRAPPFTRFLQNTVKPRFTVPQFTITPIYCTSKRFPNKLKLFHNPSQWTRDTLLIRLSDCIPGICKLQCSVDHVYALFEGKLVSFCSTRRHVIETPIYHSPQFTAQFYVPKNCAVNRGFTVLALCVNHCNYDFIDVPFYLPCDLCFLRGTVNVWLYYNA